MQFSKETKHRTRIMKRFRLVESQSNDLLCEGLHLTASDLVEVNTKQTALQPDTLYIWWMPGMNHACCNMQQIALFVHFMHNLPHLKCEYTHSIRILNHIYTDTNIYHHSPFNPNYTFGHLFVWNCEYKWIQPKYLYHLYKCLIILLLAIHSIGVSRNEYTNSSVYI